MRPTYPLVVMTAGLLVGCGGGGGGGGGGPLTSYTPGTPSPNGDAVSFTRGVYQPSSSLADKCAAPRTDTDPQGRPWPDRAGVVADENNFLRSYSHETYLWYRELPDINPNSYDNPVAYFDELKTDATTASGRPKDNFHFVANTDDYLALVLAGADIGYGVNWLILNNGELPRRIVVPFVEPGSPADGVLARGDEVLLVDGRDAVNGATPTVVQALNAGLFPVGPDETHTLRVRSRDGVDRDVTLTSAAIQTTPVPEASIIVEQSGDRVGYMLFNDHLAPAEAQLIDAIEFLQAQGAEDLIIDLRYNGGGFLDIASELAYMIAGDATAGRTFERLRFNDKHPTTNPITGEPLAPVPFHQTTQFADVAAPLPTLNLQRVYVLTGENTCSASESIINGLSGIGVPVYQIGGATCGKPYGFYARDNCGTTYFTIQFQGVNEDDFGDYADGFTPGATATGAQLRGCAVADDFDAELGDPVEGRLAAALAFRASNNTNCPTAAAASAQLKTVAQIRDGAMVKSPLRTNRLLRE